MHKKTIAGLMTAVVFIAACSDNFLTGGELSTDPNEGPSGLISLVTAVRP